MKVINITNEELTYKPTIESHEYVLKQCERIESLYNVELIVKHERGMEYIIEIKDKYSDTVLINYGKNFPGKTKNFLMGLIDARKLEPK